MSIVLIFSSNYLSFSYCLLSSIIRFLKSIIILLILNFLYFSSATGNLIINIAQSRKHTLFSIFKYLYPITSALRYARLSSSISCSFNSYSISSSSSFHYTLLSAFFSFTYFVTSFCSTNLYDFTLHCANLLIMQFLWSHINFFNER